MIILTFKTCNTLFKVFFFTDVKLKPKKKRDQVPFTNYFSDFPFITIINDQEGSNSYLYLHRNY